MVSFVRLRINRLTMTLKWSDYVNQEQILNRNYETEMVIANCQIISFDTLIID
jgi:hypothetical protein